MPIGLPSFKRLTETVCSELGADAEILQSQPDTPFDQIFSRLKRDFGDQAVLDVVSKETRTPKNAPTAFHEALLTLSSSHDGKPRLVTTNFDLLFEKAHPKLPRYICPVLPDFRVINDFEGVVYLHGRLASKTTRPENRSSLILSSAEFGHAYLSQGWAAQFVRELLQRYTVVLVGYSADDPPVRYLLEGLQLSDRRNANKVFSFSAGSEKEVIAHWRERNATAIPYSNEDGKHTMLWSSLTAWADRAKSKNDWMEGIARLAIEAPSQLTAVQRGQVVSLVSSAEGAKSFSDTKPAPHPEWICVFDRIIRMSDVQKENAYLEKPRFDPQETFGLDGDPPRPDKSDNESNSHERRPLGVDVLSTFPGETANSSSKSLINSYRRQSEKLPPRLWHLVRWIADNSSSPTIIWWLARQNTINQELVQQIKWKLEHSKPEDDKTYHQLLDWLLEIFETESWDGFGREVFEISRKLGRTNWSASSRRDLHKFLTPKLAVNEGDFFSVQPPVYAGEPISFHKLLRFEIEYPEWHNSCPNIPKEHLAETVRYACSGLVHAAKLIEETDQYVHGSPTFFPEEKPGSPTRSKGGKHLLWVGSLFHRLCEENPELAKQEYNSWPNTELVFLDKLRLYALSHSKVFSGSEVSSCLLLMGETPFWFERNRRDLLLLIKMWWRHFKISERRNLLLRIVDGPKKWKGEKRKEYVRRKAFASVSILEWLLSEDCELPKWTQNRLVKLRKDVPNWQSDWAKNAADSHEGRGGYVGTDASHEALNGVPLDRLAKEVSKHTTRPFAELTDYRPFKGVIQDELSRAISLLGYEARKGKYPVDLWRETISSWPENSTKRQKWLFAHRLSRLPNETQFELRYYHVNWLRNHLPELAKQDRNNALKIWDQVYQAIIASGSEATESARGFSYIGGKQVEHSKRTYSFASGPVSDLTEILMSLIVNVKRRQGSGVPKYIRHRLESLWKAPGEGADHSVSRTTLDIVWLEWLDPEWAREKILPMFQLDHNFAEPAWSGAFFQNKMFRDDLFRILKPQFLDVGNQMLKWRWSEGEVERYAEFTVLGCWWHTNGQGYVSWDETRKILKTVGDRGRSTAIRMLSNIISGHDAWVSFGKLFFEKAWPRELSFQTGTTSYSLVNLAENTGEHFPDVVKTIAQFVYPSSQTDLFVFKMKKERDGVEEEGSELATRYPNEVLILLDRMISEDAQVPPYDLAALMKMIAYANPALRQDRRWLRLHRLSGG